MKKIILSALFIAVFNVISAQNNPMKGFEKIFKPAIPTQPELYQQRPQVILTGLDSIQIREIVLNTLIRQMNYDYDIYGHTTLYEDLTFDLNGNILSGYKQEISYINNLLDNFIEYEWQTNMWKALFRHRYFYNAQNNIDYIMVDTMTNSGWTDHMKHIYSYNSNNLVTSVLGQYFNGYQWLNSWKINYTYNASDQLVEEIRQFYDSGNWHNQERSVYFYDSNGNMIEKINYFWDTSIPGWKERTKLTLTYNPQNRITEEYRYQYNNGTWEYNRKELYFFNSDNDMNRQESYNYDTNTATWENDTKMTFNHDPNVDNSQLLIPFDGGLNFNGIFNHKVTDGAMYQGNGSNWSHAANIYLFYSDRNILSLDNDLPVKFNVYPNPVHNVLHIKSSKLPDKVEIYSLTGQKVISLEHHNTIPTDNLNTGFYIVKIYLDNQVQTIKILKK